MKKTFTLILVTLVLLTSNFNVFADEDKNDFIDVVENNENYKKYFDQISNLEVNKVVETDEGIRKTVSYILDSEHDNVSRKLIFIGDSDNEIIKELVLIQTDTNYSLIDLSEGRTNTINYTTRNGERGAVYQCSKYTCNKWKTTVSLTVESGCPLYIGESCKVLGLLGSNVYIYLCQVGVFLACHTTVGKGCAGYYEELSVCSI